MQHVFKVPSVESNAPPFNRNYIIQSEILQDLRLRGKVETLDEEKWE